MERIVLSTAGKINLFLRVLTREFEGYHHVETLYQSVEVRDLVEITSGGNSVVLESTGFETPAGALNLAVKAANAYLETVDSKQAVHIRLEKNIPVGAGLGGGSADAAAVLKGLNVLFDESLSDAELTAVAGRLGSDVPFALRGGTALGWSRGDRLITLSPLPAWPALICVPDFPVLTGDAYRLLDEKGKTGTPEAVRYDPPDFYSLSTLKDLATNDFEAVIVEQHPVLAEIKDTFLQLGGHIALMSGTGSAVFALFSSERERAGCQRAIGEKFDYHLIKTRLTAEGIHVQELE